MERGPGDVVGVDVAGAGRADRAGQAAPADTVVEPLAPARGQEFGVVGAGQPGAGGEDDGRRNHGSGQGTAADFVDAAEEGASPPQFPVQVFPQACAL